MSRNTRRTGFGEVLALIGDAVAAAAAVRAHRQPDALTLRRLGIDPEQFDRIGRP